MFTHGWGSLNICGKARCVHVCMCVHITLDVGQGNCVGGVGGGGGGGGYAIYSLKTCMTWERIILN